MLFSERYFLRQALLKKADMNRVRDLFKARDVVRQYARDLTDVRYTCAICGLADHACDHCGNCEAYYHDEVYTYCPDCGEYLDD